MKTMKELIDEQVKLIEEMENLNVQFSKNQQAIDTVTQRIADLKEQQDYGSFKFILSIIPDILNDITKRHKIHESRNIQFNDTVTFIVPISNEECSDDNPINVCKCDRCTVLHFKKILESLLSNYLAK